MLRSAGGATSLVSSLLGKTAVDAGMASSGWDGAPSTSVVWMDTAIGSSERSAETDAGWADERGTSGPDKICLLDVCSPSANIGCAELSAFEGSPSWSAFGVVFSVAFSCGCTGCTALRATVGISAKGGKCWVVLVSVALISKSIWTGG